MFSDGPKRAGRFLKKGSKVLEKVSLLDFSFVEITDTPIVSLDNSKRSIIHAQYHDTRELDAGVAQPPKFNDDLVPESARRPVLLPLDFTAEYERNRRLRKDRAQRLDDDEFDFEFEAAQRANEKAREADAAANPPAAAPVAAPVAAVAKPGVEPPSAKELVDAANQSFKIMKEGGVTPGPATATLAAAATAAAAVQKAAPAPPTPSEAKKAEQAADFIANAEPTPLDPEVAAARAYKQRLELEAQNKTHLEQLAQEAKAAGYNEGFRTGEEKGEMQVRQAAGELFAKVGELIHEFSQLKHVVLDNVQQNFYELCQAMAEALIKREFSIHPEAFVTVLRRAIGETVAPGKFKVRVHPETFDRVAALDDPQNESIKGSLVKDPDLAPGDFKIESELSVVDVNVGKMIAQLLSQADLDLFGDKGGEKAS